MNDRIYKKEIVDMNGGVIPPSEGQKGVGRGIDDQGSINNQIFQILIHVTDLDNDNKIWSIKVL